MMVLCILLAMLSLFLSLKLIYQRKLVQKVKKQIDFLIDRDTQTEIMVEKTDGTIQDLAASINHLLKKYRSMGQEIEQANKLKEKLEKGYIKFKHKIGNNGKLFGSVTEKDIAEEIDKVYNVKIDKKKVSIDIPIKELGSYTASVKLYEGIIAKVKISVVGL